METFDSSYTEENQKPWTLYELLNVKKRYIGVPQYLFRPCTLAICPASTPRVR